MANDVFANGREISCKAADGKSIAAFPDVCFTPPENPATPPGTPVPYPNTGMAKDTTSGSKNVKISKKEVMLKNKSYFKKSTGDEAGNATKKGVVTSVNRGKVYFTSWSMDVKVEGQNAVRHFDLSTHNHASQPPNTPPWQYMDSMAVPPSEHPCKEEIVSAQEECSSSKVKHGKRTNCTDECKKAMGCILVPKSKDKEMCCTPNNTGDHLIEDHWIRSDGELLPEFSHLAEKKGGRYVKLYGPYGGAPTMCVNNSRYHGKHGVAHGTRGVMEDNFIKPGKRFTYAAGRGMAIHAHKHAYPDSGCSRACIESQLDDFYGSEGQRELAKPDRKQSLRSEQRSNAMERVYKGRGGGGMSG